MEDLKKLVEDFIEYTKEFSISEDEWYWNVDSARKTQDVNEKHISNKEFERAIREEILYEFLYNIDGIKRQMETDLSNYYEEELYFHNASKIMESKIQKIFKDFKINRY